MIKDYFVGQRVNVFYGLQQYTGVLCVAMNDSGVLLSIDGRPTFIPISTIRVMELAKCD